MRSALAAKEPGVPFQPIVETALILSVPHGGGRRKMPCDPVQMRNWGRKECLSGKLTAGSASLIL